MFHVAVFTGKNDDVSRVLIKSFWLEKNAKEYIENTNEGYNSSDKYWELCFLCGEIKEFETNRQYLEQLI